jgi:hypothetical protein
MVCLSYARSLIDFLIESTAVETAPAAETAEKQ